MALTKLPQDYHLASPFYPWTSVTFSNNFYHSPEILRLASCLRDIFARLTYKPNWKFEVEESLFHGLRLVISMTVPSTETGNPIPIGLTERLEDPPPGWDRGYALDLIKKQIWQLEEHEMKEWLKVDGECVDDPHPEVAKFPKPKLTPLDQQQMMSLNRLLDMQRLVDKVYPTGGLNFDLKGI